MRYRLAGSTLCALMLVAGSAGMAGAQTCVKIDETYDTLPPDERTAARLLLAKQFERAGIRIAADGCADTYLLSHIRLGSTISVTLSGPLGTREATALGLDDLPAVYSQMVRSLTTGQPMGLGVVDRSNVSATQDEPPRRVHSEGYWYTRLGFGSMFGPSTQEGAAFGFGYRTAFDRFGLDVSFFNGQMGNDRGYQADGGSIWSMIKLQGLVFTHPAANRSGYFGGGLSYGRADLREARSGDYPRYGRGSGLQADLTAGYEITRAMSTRIFVQADVTLPFYEVQFERYSYLEPPAPGRYLIPVVTRDSRYAPSVALSVGFGWQRRARR
jgi:hypothetical protein